MGAVVAAATHAPITAIIIIFELTQTIKIIPPLMAACVLSTLVTTFLQRDSIYTMKLRRRGIDLYEEQSHNVLKSLYVHDIIDREPAVLPRSANLETLLERVLESGRTEFFVVNERDELVGTIHLHELTRMLVEQEVLRNVVVAEDLVDTHRADLTEDDDLDLVMQMFSHGVADELPILASDTSRKLVGSVHKSDVIQAYNQEVMRRDLAGQVSSTVLAASRGQQVVLGGGYVLQEIQPPPRFLGKTIRELDIGRAWRVQVVLLRKRAAAGGHPTIRVPTGDDRIDEGDRLVVAGSRGGGGVARRDLARDSHHPLLRTRGQSNTWFTERLPRGHQERTHRRPRVCRERGRERRMNPKRPTRRLHHPGRRRRVRRRGQGRRGCPRRHDHHLLSHRLMLAERRLCLAGDFPHVAAGGFPRQPSERRESVGVSRCPRRLPSRTGRHGPPAGSTSGATSPLAGVQVPIKHRFGVSPEGATGERFDSVEKIEAPVRPFESCCN